MRSASAEWHSIQRRRVRRVWPGLGAPTAYWDPAATYITQSGLYISQWDDSVGGGLGPHHMTQYTAVNKPQLRLTNGPTGAEAVRTGGIVGSPRSFDGVTNIGDFGNGAFSRAFFCVLKRWLNYIRMEVLAVDTNINAFGIDGTNHLVFNRGGGVDNVSALALTPQIWTVIGIGYDSTTDEVLYATADSSSVERIACVGTDTNTTAAFVALNDGSQIHETAQMQYHKFEDASISDAKFLESLHDLRVRVGL